MASTSSIVAQTLATINDCTTRSISDIGQIPKHAAVRIPGRRQALLLLTATTALKATELPSRAQNIPMFGLRRKLKRVEEEAEEIVKEGFEAADKGTVAAEKGIEATEKGTESSEEEVVSAASFGGLNQAGLVAGAEVIGVLVATSIVNGILA